ncbi:type II toxin-antitoxin system RelE/ParE family toxin [Bordetella genomosp. 12]|uniref:type II toxin-antitoxin system RelE/ParE family toxin n=1 Tax=Bordetella genomosp. 12 TaxID=463035 RepID=UPI001FC99B7F|nr:type II toxin-antitoxin system RelE/ParE family toxin [Bordetella genomosp. 12]
MSSGPQGCLSPIGGRRSSRDSALHPKALSQAVWLDSYARIKQAILTLEQFPHAGHAPAELPATHFLEIIAVKKRVIYEVVGDTVYIHIICDSRQDFKTKLARRPIRTFRP